MTAPRAAAASDETVEVAIEEIGARGDGIARYQGMPVFVPFTVAGDRVRARLGAAREQGRAAALLEVLEAGPGRRAPACPHFGTCGGCALQHVEDDAYKAWKRDLVVAALTRRGLGQTRVDPLLCVGPGTRRRASLKALRLRDRAVLGFYERASHRVVDVARCPVLVPRLEALIAPLRGMLAELLSVGDKADIEIALAANGADVTIRSDSALTLPRRTRLADFAQMRDLARLSWQGKREPVPEPVVERRAPEVSFAGVPVTLPPGAFLQPSEPGQAHLIDLVAAACGESAHVADLFAGCGTFALPLSRKARVHAVEGDAAMASAMRAAAGRAGLAVRLSVEVRDLDRRPLGAAELRAFDAVVFDPPRPGAKRQAAEIADSPVPLVVAVSCNPATFARDARTLCDGGYVIERVTPLDQFLWSPHVELVAVFRRSQD
jgi:23S rRNA (uracil1939-C5)-methyltransferase